MYYHIKDGRNFGTVEKIECVVSMDGVEIYRVKTTPRKWLDSTEPVRVFEKWLLDHYANNRSNIAKNIQTPFGSFRETGRKTFKFRLQIFYLKLQLLFLKFKKFFFRLK